MKVSKPPTKVNSKHISGQCSEKEGTSGEIKSSYGVS